MNVCHFHKPGVTPAISEEKETDAHAFISTMKRDEEMNIWKYLNDNDNTLPPVNYVDRATHPKEGQRNS